MGTILVRVVIVLLIGSCVVLESDISEFGVVIALLIGSCVVLESDLIFGSILFISGFSLMVLFLYLFSAVSTLIGLRLS